MEEYEIIISDSTYRLLKAIAEAEDDAFSVAAAADIDPEKFRQFLSESGLSDDPRSNQLLSAAESRAPVDTLEKAIAKLPTSRMKIRVRRESVESMTRQLSRQLGNLIESGALEVGSLLPSERQLANSLGVARSVVRGSYEYLEKAGVVNREVTSAAKQRMKVASKKSRSNRQLSSKRRKAKMESFKGGTRATPSKRLSDTESTEKRSKAKSSRSKKPNMRKKLTA